MKEAGEFEVRRPKTTKEIAVHNNQLLQELPGQMMQAMLQVQQGWQPAAWSDAMLQRPAAPRPTAEEQEQQAEEQRQQLLQRVDDMDKRGAGEKVPWCWQMLILASLQQGGSAHAITLCTPACLVQMKLGMVLRRRYAAGVVKDMLLVAPYTSG
jgi:hypothetical protein